VVSDDLPSAWRLQSLLLGAGLVPRAVQLADLDTVGDQPADLVVFDDGVPGAVAIEVLGRVRPPQGAAVAPSLFLTRGGGVATSTPGERRLDVGASDQEIATAVDELIASTPRPEPRVMPPIEEIDVGEVVGSRPGLITYRRRRGRIGVLGPLAGLALLLGAVAGYSAMVASRVPVADATPTAVASAELPGELAAQQVEPTPVVEATATVRPIGGPVVEDSGAARPRPPALATHPPALLAPPGLRPGPAGAPPLDPTAAQPTAESGLEGRVTDASTGHGLPGAVVAYRGPVSGQTTTGGDGRYRVPNLPPGAYDVVAVAPGYAQSRNRAGVVAETSTTDNLALTPMAGASVVPFLTVTDQRSGHPVAAYGYPVRTGDTLRSIAERAGTTTDEILALNRIDDADRLEPGQVIYLPASTFGQK
jgi:LysM repeat protein